MKKLIKKIKRWLRRTFGCKCCYHTCTHDKIEVKRNFRKKNLAHPKNQYPLKRLNNGSTVRYSSRIYNGKPKGQKARHNGKYCAYDGI